MDYPKSVPGVGLIGGKFVDENLASGQQGSLIPASWGNQITDEVISVLLAAGILPSETSSDQLLSALNARYIKKSGDTMAGALETITPPQFDTSKKAVNAEFVQRALGNLSGSYVQAGNYTLPALALGRWTQPSDNATITLPTPISIGAPEGSTVTFMIGVRSGVSFVAGSGCTLGIGKLNLTSYSTAPGETITIVAQSGTQWGFIGSLKHDDRFKSLLASPGYQVLPSGLIFQGGGGATSAAGASPVTFPIAFPNGLITYGVVAVAALAVIATVDSVSVSAMQISGWTTSGARVAASARWFAIGY